MSKFAAMFNPSIFALLQLSGSPLTKFVSLDLHLSAAKFIFHIVYRPIFKFLKAKECFLTEVGGDSGPCSPDL
jgi:hypothetical protein